MIKGVRATLERRNSKMQLRRNAPGNWPPEISIRSTDALADRHVVPALAAFRRRHSNVLCRVETTAARETPVDIWVNESIVRVHANVITKRLATNHWWLFASENYVARFGLPQSVDDLQSHSFVLGLDSLRRCEPFAAFEKRIQNVNVALRSSSLTAIHRGIREGLGLGLLPDYLGWNDAGLIPANLDIGNSSSGVWLLVDARRATDPLVASMVNFIVTGSNACWSGRGTYEQAVDCPTSTLPSRSAGGTQTVSVGLPPFGREAFG